MLSLILWGALIIVVTLKYVLILLRSDNNGEGGTLSLTALDTRAMGRRSYLCFWASSARPCSRRLGDHAGHLGAVGGSRAWSSRRRG